MTHTETPEREYVKLHRAIEQGKATDATWARLSQVCIELGYEDEAFRATRNIVDPSALHSAEVYLAERGVIERPSEVLRARAQTRSASLKDELTDSVAYLFLEHMPMTVMSATLVFPLVLGLGGFLTAGTEFWVFPAIALLPVLAAVGVVGGMGRQILLEAACGIEEPQRFPEFTRLFRSSMRFFIDAAIVALVLLGPGVLAFKVGLAWSTCGSMLLIGCGLIPIVMALRQVRNDWNAFSPATVLLAMYRVGSSYLFMVLLAGLLTLPAVAAISLTSGSDLYLRLSFVGPLVIAPLFVASRVMGRILFLHRRELGDLIADQSGRVAAEFAPTERTDQIETYSSQQSPRQAPAGARQQRRPRAPLNAPRHPENRRASSARAERQARQEQRASQQPRQAQRQPQPRQPQPRQPQQQQVRRPWSAQAPAQERQPQRSPRSGAVRRARPDPDREQRRRAQQSMDVEGLPSLLSIGEELPDLANLPGARILRGREREEAGAAATPNLHREDFE